MAGNLTEQTTRAQKWLAGQKWKIRKAVDYRPRSDVQVVERLLENVPREFLSGIVQYLQSAVSETNPLIEGKPYFGTWLFSRHIWERNESPDDNTVTFIQTMIAGAGVTAAHIVEKGCAYTITQTFYWDVTALPTVTQSTSGINYSLAAVSRDRETGLYSCVLEQRVRLTVTTGAYTSGRDSSATETTQEWKGVRTGNLDDTGAAVPVDNMALEVGKVKKQQIQKNDDCTTDVKQAIEAAVDQPITEWEKTHAEQVATVKATQGTAETIPGDPAAGTIVEISQDYTPHGKARKAVRTRTAVDQPITEWVKDHSETAAIVKATQGTAETEPSAPADGVIVEVSQDPTPFGKARKAVRTRTAIDQPVSEWQKDHAETVVTVKATQGTVETIPSDPANGVIVEVTQDLTPFGKARKAIRTRTAVDQPMTEWQKAHDETAVIVKATQGAAETIPNDPAAGTIVEVSQDPTPFGKARKAVRTRTAIDQPVTEWSKTHAETVSNVKGTQGTVETEPSAPAAGTVVDVSQDMTQYGKARKQVRTRTAVNQTATAGESRADQTSATDIATQATAEVAATPEAGKIVRVRNRPTEFGRIATEKETITPVNQTATDAETRSDQTVTTAKATQAESAASATRGTGEDNKIIRVRNRPTEFGKVATEREVITPVNQTATNGESRADQTSETLLATQADTAITATPMAGKIVRARNRPTEFGKVATELETITPADQTATLGEDRYDQSSTKTIHTQADAEVTAPPTATAGNIKRVENRPTEFGKYATVAETITAKNQTTTAGEARADQTSVVTIATQATTAVAATPQVGKIVRVDNAPTEFGRFRTREDVITPTNQTATNGEARADQTSETLIATQADSAVSATPVAGKIVRARNRPTEFGKTATEIETITPTDQSVTLGEDRHDQSSTKTTHTQADAAVTAPPTATAGNIKRVENRATEFGKFATVAETITTKTQTTTNGESRADQTNETLIETQATSAVSATPVSGKIVRARNRPTEFGKFSTEVETITPTSQTASDGETRSDQTSVTSRATQAASEASATRGIGEDNKIIRVTNRPTEFGKFATAREVITPVAIHSYASYKCNSGSQPGTLTTYYWRNQAAGWGEDLMDAASDNAHKSMSPPVINEFGLEDGSASVFVPDVTVEQTPDTITLTLITTDLVQQRMKDTVTEAGVITTQVQDVTYRVYTHYVTTSAAAEVAIGAMATKAGTAGVALAERSIRSFTTNGGLRMYIAEAKTTPLHYGEWLTPPT